MTNKELLQIAMEQSALDINCNAEDFLCEGPVIVKSGVGPKARKYYKECGMNTGKLWGNTSKNLNFITVLRHQISIG